MKFIYYLLLSIISGVLAGMGMGGGTLLIPALTLIMKVEQDLAQSINLLVFVPTAIVVCIIYTKNKLINYKKSWLIMIIATIVSVIAVLVAVKLENKILSICFGSFLIVLGGVQFVIAIINMIKQKSKTGYIAQKKI